MRFLHLTYLVLGLFQGGYFALWLPKLQARGFTLSQIALLFSIEIAVSTALDLPLGRVADRIGHKKVTISGFITYLVAVLIPTLHSSPYALAAGVILIGAGNAFISGSLDSWAADIQAASHGNLHAKHFITRDQIQRLGIILGSLSIPFTVSFGMQESVQGTWVIFVFIAVVLIGIGFKTTEGKIETPALVQKPSTTQSVFSILKKPGVTILVAAWFLFGISNGAVDLSLYPRLTQDFKLSDSWIFGVIQAIVSFSRLAGGELWKRAPSINSYWVPGTSIVISSFFFVGFGMAVLPSVALILWVARVGFLSAYFSTNVSSLISNSHFKNSRATILSISSVAAACGEFCFTSLYAFLPQAPAKVAIIGGIVSALSGVLALLGGRVVGRH